MLIRILFIMCCCLFMGHVAFSQSSKKRKSKSQPTAGQPNSVDPYFPQLQYGPKKTGTKRGTSKGLSVTYNAEKRYYARLAEVEKERRKSEKEMMKPEYSDPMYFGHKHPPKKHKPGKMKFCKVCGIRH